MAKTNADIKYPALSEIRDKSLRVAAFCRNAPEKGAPWSQHNFYSLLVDSFPKWEFAGQNAADKTDVFMGGFPQLFSDCEKGKIDLIIVKSLSAFNRNIYRAIYKLEELKRLKSPVGVYFEDINFHTMCDYSILFLYMIAAFTEQESVDKSKGIRIECCNYSETNPLKRARMRKGSTQQEIADKSEITLRQYQRFENGDRQITNASFRIAMSVCKALGIAPDMLLQNGISFLTYKGVGENGQ